MPSSNEIYFFRVEGVQEFIRGKIENNEEEFYLLSDVKFVDSQGIKRNSLKSKDGMFYVNKSKIIYFYIPDVPEA